MIARFPMREARKGFGDNVPERGLGLAAPTFPKSKEIAVSIAYTRHHLPVI